MVGDARIHYICFDSIRPEILHGIEITMGPQLRPY